MSKNVCLYHRSDLDGKCSGAIVYRHLSRDVEMIGIDYGDTIPWDLLKAATVYIVDFSLQPWPDMQRLRDIASEVIWIDHHKSAIDEYKADVQTRFRGSLQVDKAACELCWEYFCERQPMPRAVKLLGRYDIWDLDWHPDVLPFQMGMRLNDNLPEDPIWDDLFRSDHLIDAAVQEGSVIIAYQKRSNASLMQKAFEHKWNDLVFLAVNAGGINSQAFTSRYDPDKHAAVMSFYYDGEQGIWTISLYSPDNTRDLSGIAKNMGGGGHPAACGFQVQDLSQVGL